MGSIILRNFGDIVDVVENRAKMAGSVQDSIRDFVKGTINEYHERISTERSWKWRKFDRSFNFSKAITTGTANVTNGSGGSKNKPENKASGTIANLGENKRIV